MKLIETRRRQARRQVDDQIWEERKPSEIENVEIQEQREPFLRRPIRRHKNEFPARVGDLRYRPRQERRRREGICQREVPELNQSVESFRSLSIPPCVKPIHLFG